MIRSRVLDDFPDAVVISAPNQGKDIGGKLALIDTLLTMELNPELVIFLHDKRSPHALEGDRWRKSLFRIIDPGLVTKILDLFKKYPNVGIIGPSGLISNEYDSNTKQFLSENRLQLKKLMETFGIHTLDYRFVAGTMFWARFSILRSFFENNHALYCREFLEKGNIMDEEHGTFTHAWERLLCWIVTARKYEIKGI
jgi:lipopolysaccharide biosynthesis protein